MLIHFELIRQFASYSQQFRHFCWLGGLEKNSWISTPSYLTSQAFMVVYCALLLMGSAFIRIFKSFPFLGRSKCFSSLTSEFHASTVMSTIFGKVVASFVKMVCLLEQGGPYRSRNHKEFYFCFVFFYFGFFFFLLLLLFFFFFFFFFKAGLT